MQPQRIFGLLLRLAVVVTSSLVAPGVDAEPACAAAYSRCFTLESAPPSPFGRELKLLPQPAFNSAPRVGATLDWQTRPLVVNSASPDPFDRELVVIDHWLTSQMLAQATLWPSIRLGLRQPISWGSLASQAAWPGSLGRERRSIAFGDPELSAIVDLSALRATWRDERPSPRGSTWLVLQRISLPFGSDESLLHQRAISYAPALAWHFQARQLALAMQLGAHLRRSASFGDVRFGSQAELAFGSAYQLGSSGLSAELLLRPALSRDESLSQRMRHHVRRFPASWMASYSYRPAALGAALSVGGSLPLSTRSSQQLSPTGSAGDAPEEVVHFSGPPGPSFRIRLAFDYRWAD